MMDLDDVLDTGLSPLERLPCELFTMIIEFVPDSVLQVRLVSTHLKTQVDTLATARTIFSLVDKLEIEQDIQDKSKIRMYRFPMIKIEMTISNSRKALFGLRHKLLGNDRINSRKSIKGRQFEWQRPNIVEEDILDHICSLIGRKVRQVTIAENFRKMDRITHIAKLLDNLQFTHLQVRLSKLSDPALTYIKTMINKHNIEHFSISLSEVNTTQEAEQILLELSSQLLTLHIYQEAHQTNCMFGVTNANWAQLILKMFARKLDRLDFESQRHIQYLPKDSRDVLIERLPMLEKKIWFRAVIRCNKDKREERNGFLIEMGDFYPYAEFRVRHSSRLNEPRDLFRSY